MKRRAGCSFCRLRHLKCDNAQPACFNCSKRSRECVYESALRIRLSEYTEGTKAAAQLRDPVRSAPGLYSEKQMVTDPLCMRLLEFFKNNIAKYMDIVSDAHHFSTTVVSLALTCPMLLYACLSYSAVILKRLDKANNAEIIQAEQRFLSECYRLLIPALNNRAYLSDPALLATTVLLRAGEQFQYEENPNEDPKYHLRGSFSLIADDPIWQLSGTGVREVSFWTYIRQDIHSAVIERKTCMFNNNNNLQFFSLGSDCIWTNRITFITARACNFVFGNRKSASARAQIVKQINDWFAKLPPSFEKYHESDGIFPVIIYMHPWHTCALQYYYFALLLLKEGDERELARTFLGVTISAADTGLKLNSVHLVEYAATYLETEAERDAVVAYFEEVSRGTGWPTVRTFKELSRIWNVCLQ